ncbi:hypothetical protein ACLOJK_011489 [Asimina triloba]
MEKSRVKAFIKLVNYNHIMPDGQLPDLPSLAGDGRGTRVDAEPADLLEACSLLARELHLFLAGITLDDITFVCVLLACTRGGLVAPGWQIFECMEKKFSVTPKLEHYGYMVDLLRRVGIIHDEKERDGLNFMAT